ncbi:MAG: hypothetical protein ACI4QT_02110 [Kiritimatiellia bacterium]
MMNLKYHKAGLQFFFITLVVEGRLAVLSRVVDEETPPELTRLGEIVQAGLLAFHPVWPGLRLAGSMIMPDHIHFIVAIDYARETVVTPLFLSHRLIDAVEIAAGAMAAKEAQRTGGAGAPATHEARLRALATFRGEGEMKAAAEGGGDWRLKSREEKKAYRELIKKRRAYMAGLMKRAIAEYEAAKAGVSGAQPPVRLAVFERSPYIELSFSARQLEAAKHYTYLNPARYLWKKRHPDLFICRRVAMAKILQRTGNSGTPATSPKVELPAFIGAIGYLPLLGSPFKLHARLTMKKTAAEHESTIAEMVEKARHGWVVVSGFISAGEKELLKHLKAEPRARFIKTLPYALPPRYDPSAEDSREIAAGRMVIVSMVENEKISALEMKRETGASHRFRENCLKMNALAAAMAGGNAE